MMKFWLKWFIFFVIVLLALEALKAVVMKIPFSANYLIAIIFIALQTLAVIGFFFYAAFVVFFGKKISRKKLLVSFSASFVCLLTLLEILFSYWLYHPGKTPSGLRWAYKYYYDSYNFNIMQYEKNLIAYDDRLLYTLKPGAKANFSNAEFSTPVAINKSGLRDNEESLVSPEIICLGDSFTMGWGIDESQTFPEIIEKESRKKVLNAGIPSYGTARELLLLDRLDVSGLKYLIIQYCSNDLEENTAFIANNYNLKLTPFSQYASAMRSYSLSRKYFPAKNFLLISNLWMKQLINNVYPFFKFSGQPYDEEFNSREHALVFLKVLLRFREKLKNVKIIVTSIDINKFHDNQFTEELSRLTQAEPGAGKMKNISFVNTTAALTNDDYFILDYHIKPSGQRKIADKLLQEIR